MVAVGVLGLGRMGGPIAARLAAVGHDVHGFDPTVGGPGLGSVVRASDTVFTVLPGAVEVARAAPEILANLAPGSLWIDLTSNDPRAAIRLAAAATAHGVDFLASPMGGGPADAAGGELTFFASGPAVDLARPLLSDLGRIEHLGESIAAGCSAKLIVNLLWFGQVVAVTEAALLGRSLGISPTTLGALLPSTAAQSAFADRHLPGLLRGDYLETFAIDRVVDELDILTELARDGGVPFELSALVARLHRAALEHFGPIDGELLAAKLLEVQAGAPLADASHPPVRNEP